MRYKPMLPIRYLVVHCSATPPKMDIGVKEMRQWHIDRGWFDIGYHKVIRRDGSIEDGRPLDMPGAHAREWNRNTIGICLIGGVKEHNHDFSEDNFTKSQYEALKTLLNELMPKYPNANVIGHRDLPYVNKGCPSFDVQAWMGTWKPMECKP